MFLEGVRASFTTKRRFDTLNGEGPRGTVDRSRGKRQRDLGLECTRFYARCRVLTLTVQVRHVTSPKLTTCPVC